MRERRALMVLDWGIGGLPLFRRLEAALGGVDLFYFSDSGGVPYGKRGPGELRARLGEIAAFASGLGVGTIAAACNALSSALPGAVSRAGGVEVLSLVHGYLAGPLPGGRRIGVIGGERTIGSGLYQRALEAAGNLVSAAPAQGLSALVEAGDLEAVPPLLGRILPALGEIDALVLACTHYPAAAPAIRALCPGLELIDPGDALRRACLDRFPPGGRGGLRAWYTTGDPDGSRAAAEKSFGLASLPFVRIALPGAAG